MGKRIPVMGARVVGLRCRSSVLALQNEGADAQRPSRMAIGHGSCP